MNQNTPRAIRGGSWFFSARFCRSAHRDQYQPDDRYGNLGFRIVSCSPDTKRVIRGGSWDGFARFCRSAFRFQFQPDYRYGNLGFRVVQLSN